MNRFDSQRSYKLLRPIKIAFVKNSSYRDLYFKVGKIDKSLIFSSEGRSGPVGLVESEFESTYLIVKNSPDPECQVHISQKRDHLSPSELEYVDSLMSRLKNIAIVADDVDWSEFDLVWAFESCIPSRITRKYPRVVWATMLENHMHPKFISYLRKPPIGYDLVFTQAFGRNPRSLFYGDHVVDWPYSLTKHDTIQRLLDQPNQRHKFLMCDVHHDTAEIKRKFCDTAFKLHPRRQTNIRIEFLEYLEMLVQSTYYISVNLSRSLWGNALPEAASAGCLVIANPSQTWNPFTISSGLRAANLDQAVSLLMALENDYNLFDTLKSEQNKLVDWHCFYRPIYSTLSVVQHIAESRKLNLKAVYEKG